MEQVNQPNRDTLVLKWGLCIHALAFLITLYVGLSLVYRYQHDVHPIWILIVGEGIMMVSGSEFARFLTALKRL